MYHQLMQKLQRKKLLILFEKAGKGENLTGAEQKTAGTARAFKQSAKSSA